LCTPDRRDIEEFVSSCIEGGVGIVQLREKSLEAKELIARARLVQSICTQHGVPFIINDRPDIALFVEADGVHVGQDDVDASFARKLLGPDRIVGLSTHCTADLEKAQGEPIDYISAGPIVETPTKPGRKGTGLDYIKEATRTTSTWETTHGESVPVFVTGGVTPETVRPIVKSGARHFVVVRYLTQARDPFEAAKHLTDAINEAISEQDESSVP
jgi:thiamine-phosphate pyrophosphorylase